MRMEVIRLHLRRTSMVELEKAGLLRAPGGARGVQRLRERDEPVFASAADALDFLKGAAKPLLINEAGVGGFVGIGPLRDEGPVDRVIEAPFEAAGRAIGRGIGAVSEGVGSGIEELRRRNIISTEEELRNRGSVRNVGVKPSAPAISLAGRIANAPAYRFGIGSFTPEGRRQAEIYGEAGPFSLFRVKGETVRTLARGESRRGGIVGLRGGLEQPMAITDPEIEAFANTYLTEADQRNQFDEDRLNRVFGWFEFMRYGAPALEGEQAKNQIVGEALQGWERDLLVAEARKRGQDIADPSRYTDAELARRAFTREGRLDEAQRSAFRQFGELSALPAAAAAVASVVTSGDKEQWIQLAKDLFGPYTYLWRDIERRGVGPALSSFAQERPLDAILIANAATRITGRAAGAGGRLAGGTSRGLLGSFVKSQPAAGSFRARIGEFARENRPVTLPSAGVSRVEGLVEEPVDAQIAIGFTGKNLLDTLVLEGRARLAAGFRNAGFDRTARITAGNRAKRAVRIAENRRDDAMAQVGREFGEFARGLNSRQLLRLAVDLVTAQVRAGFDEAGRLVDDLEPYDPASRAAFYRDAAAAKLRAADESGSLVDQRKLRREARSLEQSAKTWQRIAETELPPGLVDAARDALRRAGQDNDVMVAYLMDELGIRDSPKNLSRADTLAAGLVPDRDFIDIGDADVGVVPARVVGVEDLGGGRMRVTAVDVRNPLNRRVLDVEKNAVLPRLSSGLRRAKYIRQFIEFEAQFTAAAKALTQERRGVERLRVREANRPLFELGALEGKYFFSMTHFPAK